MRSLSINPPIRGSIEGMTKQKSLLNFTKYQSPYKGFNRIVGIILLVLDVYRINPPIRGSIVNRKFVVILHKRINPPIRGSIEQDNALFENYSHKR